MNRSWACLALGLLLVGCGKAENRTYDAVDLFFDLNNNKIAASDLVQHKVFITGLYVDTYGRDGDCRIELTTKKGSQWVVSVHADLPLRKLQPLPEKGVPVTISGIFEKWGNWSITLRDCDFIRR